jgi:hypothetical protein
MFSTPIANCIVLVVSDQNPNVLISSSRTHLGSDTGEMFARNDDTLNLSSAFVDLVDFRIPHQLLHWVITVEAIASKDL